MLSRRTVLFISLVSIGLFFYNFGPSSTVEYHSITSSLSSLASFITSMSTSSSLSGWHARTLQTPYSAANAFEPKLDSLTFAVLHSTPVEPEGFTMALFKGTSTSDDAVAVDALGRVLLVSEKDAAGLTELAKSVNTLPKAGGFRNTWRIKQQTTSQPISRLLIKDGNNLQETSVQGFATGKKELKTAVGDVTELPDALYDFVGLVLEARDGYEIGSAGAVVEQVQNVLKDASVV
ncbi:hypothetical protein K435DRAFT_782196 [Dendrothele bispora CBS 962.96]|uniref:Uncharacterized protein n=1 Tax=Dendrothele bispora (strain CBS 962.96) TaxID=1314807 RepID=A0A4S8LH28_DENBC|nr:hypothetical protein K435DRAFT_782196 [Dendrothele bispora CBS 962.96]